MKKFVEDLVEAVEMFAVALAIFVIGFMWAFGTIGVLLLIAEHVPDPWSILCCFIYIIMLSVAKNAIDRKSKG